MRLDRLELPCPCRAIEIVVPIFGLAFSVTFCFGYAELSWNSDLCNSILSARWHHRCSIYVQLIRAFFVVFPQHWKCFPP